MVQHLASQHVFVGRHVPRGFTLRVAVPRRLDAAKQGRSDGRGDLVLDREYVLEFAVVTLRPKMRLGFAVDELHGHPYPIRSLAHASLDDVVDAEFAGDLLGLDRLSLVDKNGVARDHQ
jgi:hypothetical protein